MLIISNRAIYLTKGKKRNLSLQVLWVLSISCYEDCNYQASAYEACNHTHTPLHTPNTLETYWRRAKKACLVGLRKFQGMRHVTRLKQQGFLSFTSCKKQKSYEKIMCIYLFYWFSGETCIIRSNRQRCSI